VAEGANDVKKAVQPGQSQVGEVRVVMHSSMQS
jgi:hypothetical protein